MNTDKITQYLEQMAAKLGVAAEHVYGVLVRQQLAEGIVWAVGCAVYIGFLVWLGRKLYAKQAEIRERNASKSYFNREDDISEGIFAYNMLGGISGVLAFALLLYGVMHVVSPEYYAIREIMDVIGGATR
ncbi:hypothetical protein A6764_00040 [Brevibacillus sp. WF146]|uniref:hypothetical protein n=1 Tax=Brevibacillus sp. WF146 TaxID=319501 RepID=UPI0007ED8B24|nr:hypothetical protein [Brevibacillus sp. WF146]UYZ12186.1 hypothetical protein A6764_15285 [Brevibacillus sp. WF146]UYZ13435.1 hypothetical protein A6764_00040 [Brevibacillus sp. WF146]